MTAKEARELVGHAEWVVRDLREQLGRAMAKEAEAQKLAREAERLEAIEGTAAWRRREAERLEAIKGVAT